MMSVTARPNLSEGKSSKSRAIDAAVKPTDLKQFIDTISQSAERMELFEFPGLQESAIIKMRSQILGEYKSHGRFTLGKTRDHLHFLFLTHSMRKSDQELSDMAIIDHESRLSKPHIKDIYLPGLSSYSPQELLRPVQRSDGTSAPGLSIAFVHPAFLENAPSPPESSSPTWEQWLCDFLGVKSSIRLDAKDKDDLSPEFIYIAKNRPEKSLGTLQHLWARQGHIVSNKTAMMEKIKMMPARCISGELRPLWETYLPLPHLRDHCERLMGDEEDFPFLDLGSRKSTQDLARQWAFLHREFGVSVNDDVGFLLDILGNLQDAHSEAITPEGCRLLVSLYCEIEARCLASPESAAVREIVRSYLGDINGVVVARQQNSETRTAWVNPSQCRWVASAKAGAGHQIKAIYRDIFRCSQVEMIALDSFFQRTLQVPGSDQSTQIGPTSNRINDIKMSG